MDLMHQSAETLAGRIAYLELTPFTAAEVGGTSPSAPDALWLRGGFPESFLADDDEGSFEWRTAFIQTYLERDVPALGPRVPAETLRRFWQMLAHNQGQMLNGAQLAAGLGVSGHTIARYLDILVDLLLSAATTALGIESKKALGAVSESLCARQRPRSCPPRHSHAGGTFRASHRWPKLGGYAH